MKLVASCQCGRKIQAKASLAGQKVRCPSCGTVMRLPSSKRSVQQAAQKESVQKKTVDPLSDLLDEIGHEGAQSKHSCPECKISLPNGAVLCVQCGYHLSRGKRLTTKRTTRGT